MKAGVTVSILLACVFGTAVVVDAARLCDVMASTTKIVAKLCYANGGANQSNQTLINGFFGCYDNFPGKDQFVKCQTKQFGGPLDNANTIQASCNNQAKLPGYFLCLTGEFRRAGLDLIGTVQGLNACQSQVLGIRSSRSLCH